MDAERMDGKRPKRAVPPPVSQAGASGRGAPKSVDERREDETRQTRDREDERREVDTIQEVVEGQTVCVYVHVTE